MKSKVIIILLTLGLFNADVNAGGLDENPTAGNNPRSLKEKIAFEDYPAIFGKGSVWDYFGTYPYTPNYGPTPAPPMPPMFPPFMQDDKLEEVSDQGKPNNPPKAATPEYVKHEVVVTTQAEMTCPEQFALSGDNCIKIDQKPSKLGCKEGWNYQDGFCKGVELTSAKNVCDTGYEMGSNGECSKMIVAPYQIYCPEGFTLGNYNCFKQVYTSVDWTCPEGFHENGHYECTKTEAVDPMQTCPEGFNLAGNYCRKEETKAPTYMCNHGFTDVGGVCEKVKQIAPDQTCPAQYLYTDGKCIKVNAHPGSLICSRGELSGSQCVMRFDVPISKSCPGGFHQTSDDMCVMQETEPAQPFCHKSAKFDPTSNSCHGKKKEKLPAQYQCPKGFSMTSQNMCTRKTIQSPVPQCPRGHKMDKGTYSCYTQEFSKPDMVCPDSYTLNQHNMKCEMTETSSTQLSCPSGFTFDDSFNICSMKSTSPIEPHCNEPFVLSSDKQSCYHAQAFEPTLTCPHNYEIEYTGGGFLKRFKDKSNAMCKGYVEGTPTPSCPSNFEYDSVNSQCIDTETVAPDIECPEPFTDRFTPNQCTQAVYDSSKSICPIDYEMMAGQCVKMVIEKPVMMCPIGYKLVEGVCVKELYTEPTPMCPTGYTYDALVGECYYMQIDYSFAHAGPAPASGPQEALLSMDETPSTTTTTTAPPIEQALPVEAPPEPEALPPSTVQIVQQPIPIPSPVVYLPAQRPMPPSPPPPPPMPVPFFVPYNNETPKKKYK